MSLLIDRKYVCMIASRIERFKQGRHDLWNGNCPICNTDKKRRFYIYHDTKHGSKDYLSVSCHKCNYKQPFGKFLSEFDPALSSEHRMESFRERGEYKPNTAPTAHAKPSPVPLHQIVRKAPETPAKWQEMALLGATPIPTLHPNMMVVEYLDKRRIPAEARNRLFYCEDFRQMVHAFGRRDLNVPSDPRLILPLYDRWGNLHGFQGRAIIPTSNALRYVTIKRSDDVIAFFGDETINPNKPIIVVEGCIDSLFMPNCVAVMNADLSRFAGGSLYVPDWQYRNPNIIEIYEKLIAAGKRITILPDTIAGKDINNLIECGMTTSEVLKLLVANSYSGLKAKAKLSEFRKVATKKGYGKYGSTYSRNN